MDTSRTPERETSLDVSEYVQLKLNGAIFSGWYSERVLVDEISSKYLDQIQIDPEELHMNKILKSVTKKLKKHRNGNFLGIKTKAEQNYIYVDFQEQIFGHYWFLIESAKLGPKQIHFSLKVLRPVNLNRDRVSETRCQHCGKFPQDANSSSKGDNDPLSLSDIARDLQWKFQDLITPSQWWADAKPHLTLENVLKLGKFLIVLVLAGVSGASSFIIHLASHTNAFVHALSGLMRSSTPFLLSCVDAVNRLIAGFFTLIAMIWRDARNSASSSSEKSNANRLTFETRQEERRKFLEGPGFPYRRDVKRPYL